MSCLLKWPLFLLFLLRQPTILICREEIVRETWQRLVEMFGKDEIVRCAILFPPMFCRNWKNFNAKFEYLISRGFIKDDMVRVLFQLSTRSLKNFIRARMEVALESGRVYEGGPTLSMILHSKPGAFERKFGVKL